MIDHKEKRFRRSILNMLLTFDGISPGEEIPDRILREWEGFMRERVKRQEGVERDYAE